MRITTRLPSLYFGVTAKDFSHGVLLDREDCRFPHCALSGQQRLDTYRQPERSIWRRSSSVRLTMTGSSSEQRNSGVSSSGSLTIR